MSGLLVSLARHGRPRWLLRYGRSPGDALLCTAALRELRARGQRGLWMQTDFPELFEGNGDVDAVVPYGRTARRVTELLGGRVAYPDYGAHDPATDRSPAPDRHIIATMCRALGMRGTVTLRPTLRLSEAEIASGRQAPLTIAIQSTGLGARLSMKNKEWGVERFQEVVARAPRSWRFVQVGAATDPPLAGAVDARGGPLRHAAAILAGASCFVGLVGFAMHLARAVDCRSVIVYGGREAPWQSGYTANENLASEVACSPCWLWNRCDFDRMCLTAIGPDAVIAAIERQLARHGRPLPVDVDDLDAQPVFSTTRSHE